MTVAVGTGLCAAVGAFAALLGGRRGLGQARGITGDLLTWAALVALSCWLYAPYLTGHLVGAGDAYHYALQVGDYVTQLRDGHFPVFVGASEYAFNGNIHTLRTAPYFLHFAGLVDFLTGRKLGFAELLDLTVMAHALGLAFAAWRTARSVVGGPNRGWAGGLAALFVLSPAIAGSVEAFDLVATFMALAWLPVFLRGVVALLDGEIRFGTLLGTWALGLIWWAHPAVGVWCTALWVGTWLVVLGRGSRSPGAWLSVLGSATGLAVMTAYCFESVHALHLGYDLGAAAEVRGSIVATVKALWPAYLLPALDDPARMLRPGYALWIVGLGGGVVGRGHWTTRVVLLVMTAGLLLLLGAIPVATPFAWSLVPNGVLQATNTWVVQRLGPLLAALLCALGALGLRSLALPHRRAKWAAGLGLVGLLGWSIVAVQPERHAAQLSTRNAVDTTNVLDPRNVYLTRASYAMFGATPTYFTNGRTSAWWETRLLDPQTGRVVVSNAEAAVAAARRAGPDPAWRPLTLVMQSLPVDRAHGYVLEFKFEAGLPPGEIQLQSGSLTRSFTLPRSGEAAAFGSDPGNSRLIGFMPDEHEGADLWVRSTIAGVSVRAYPFVAATLPLQVTSLLPFRVSLATKDPALLETPRVWIPGYRAAVDGNESPVTASSAGSAAVGVPAGRHDVELRYVPSFALRFSYLVSLFGLAGGAALLGAGLTWRRGEALGAPRTRQAAIGVALAVGLAVAAGTFVVRRERDRPQRSGAVRLTLTLPRSVTLDAQPLVVTGRNGAADVVYVHFLSADRLEVGFDDWGTGGPTSPPLVYHPGQLVTVEIAYAALFSSRAATPPQFQDPTHSAVTVRWNGQTVLDFMAAVHPAAATATGIGVNAVGASSCSNRFAGQILQVTRFTPAARPGN